MSSHQNTKKSFSIFPMETEPYAVAIRISIPGPAAIKLFSCSTQLSRKFQLFIKVSKKAKIRKRYNQVPPMTQNTTWESDKNTNKYHLQESQEVSHFTAGGHKTAKNRQGSMTNTKHEQQTGSTKEAPPGQKKHRLGTVSKIFYWRALISFMVPTSSLFLMWIKTN